MIINYRIIFSGPIIYGQSHPLNLTLTQSQLVNWTCKRVKKYHQTNLLIHYLKKLEQSVNNEKQQVIITTRHIEDNQEHETIKQKCKSIREIVSFFVVILLSPIFHFENLLVVFVASICNLQASIEERTPSYREESTTAKRRKTHFFPFSKSVRKTRNWEIFSCFCWRAHTLKRLCHFTPSLSFSLTFHLCLQRTHKNFHETCKSGENKNVTGKFLWAEQCFVFSRVF